MALVDDLLDIQKLEDNSIEFSFKHTDLAPIIKTSVESLGSYAAEFHVTIKSENLLNAYVFIDERRIEQVLFNLLSNAIKFSNASGTVKVCMTETDHNVTVSIIDNGAGIPEHFRENIFERFAQADATSTKTVGGTGLGLNITQAIITRHDGVLDYESNCGAQSGTRFWFTLRKHIDSPEQIDV